LRRRPLPSRPTTPLLLRHLKNGHPSPNFHRESKVRNLASFKTSLNFESPTFENAARYPNFETKVHCCDDRPMSWPSFVKLGPRTPQKALSVLTPKNCTRKRAKSSIIQPRIIRFRSNFVQTLITLTLDVPRTFRVNGSNVKVTG